MGSNILGGGLKVEWQMAEVERQKFRGRVTGQLYKGSLHGGFLTWGLLTWGVPYMGVSLIGTTHFASMHGVDQKSDALGVHSTNSTFFTAKAIGTDHEIYACIASNQWHLVSKAKSFSLMSGAITLCKNGVVEWLSKPEH